MRASSKNKAVLDFKERKLKPFNLSGSKFRHTFVFKKRNKIFFTKSLRIKQDIFIQRKSRPF